MMCHEFFIHWYFETSDILYPFSKIVVETGSDIQRVAITKFFNYIFVNSSKPDVTSKIFTAN